MVPQFHDTLVSLIKRSQELEKDICSCKDTGESLPDGLQDCLENKRFTAEEIMRSADYRNGSVSPDFISAVQQAVRDLSKEIKDCEALLEDAKKKQGRDAVTRPPRQKDSGSK